MVVSRRVDCGTQGLAPSLPLGDPPLDDLVAKDSEPMKGDKIVHC